MRNIRSLEKGFLLPDVMVAVFVVSTALLAIVATMAPLVHSEFFRRDEIVAIGLAQEGIELVRNVRDNNWKSTPPKTAFEAPFPSGSVCADYSVGVSNGCSGGTVLLNTNGLYKAGASGKFTRKIDVSGSADTRTVTSTVTWGVSPENHTVTLTDTLTSWGDK